MATGGRYINNLGLRCQYGSVLNNRATEDPVIGLWTTVFTQEWDGTDGFILIPQQQQHQGTRPDWTVIKWAADGMSYVIKAVIEAKPMDQGPQQDNESDGQLQGYATNALSEVRANGQAQTNVLAIKVVGTKFVMYKVWENDGRLLAQDKRFNFPGDVDFQMMGIFKMWLMMITNSGNSFVLYVGQE
jgi:hypothetical protein